MIDTQNVYAAYTKLYIMDTDMKFGLEDIIFVEQDF